ncbi:hypothetical protein H1R17_03710 [Flavobacterium sp. xlx-214]|uniref:hypothetical protein n=1 Tax=unclassified Flavobacterium TaxID=196869 RepID=UPI0013D5A414|nr:MULTISPECIES: hypothetical protein [unclassified Flavobacterium]MBA5791997.1 hypothetical protein [Flavobacterium sp. xlx-221]QMI84251.1 hypothetical protein H1R17_03710 [Flavobacterium sp. xlx-214]
MKFFKHVCLLFLAIVSLVSCNDEEPDTVGPTIEITNIPDNKEYKFGESLVMNFKFTDQTGVYEYAYEVYSKDNLPKEFSVAQRLIDLQGYFTEINQIQTILLPEKSAAETYQEGDYIIKVQASDINQRVTTYYKPIKIVYPTE